MSIQGFVSPKWLFPNPDGGPYSRSQVSRVWHEAATAAGLTDFHFHDLRHHGATMALNAGFTASIHDGARGMEDKTDDAAVCRGYRSDASGGGGGGKWQRAVATNSERCIIAICATALKRPSQYRSSSKWCWRSERT